MRGWCAGHYDRWHKTGDVRAGEPFRKIDRTRGYFLHGGYRMVWRDGKRRPEHRVVMEQMLGRPLTRQENVHHVNGDKQDNRPANLELWSTSQPKGQRIEDKVAWAREILNLYGDDFVQPRLLMREVPD